MLSTRLVKDATYNAKRALSKMLAITIATLNNKIPYGLLTSQRYTTAVAATKKIVTKTTEGMARCCRRRDSTSNRLKNANTPHNMASRTNRYEACRTTKSNSV